MNTVGCRSPWTTRKTLKVIAAVGLLIGGSRLLHSIYWEEWHRAESQLSRIPGLANVQIRGWDDITYEVHSVQFEIADRPGEMVVVWTDRKDLLNRKGHVHLQRIGPWEFHSARFRPPSQENPQRFLASGFTIDVGFEGEHRDRLPCRIEDVSDVVANYDRLVETFASWPDESTWGVLEEMDGSQTAYCRTSVAFTGSLAPPPQCPDLW